MEEKQLNEKESLELISQMIRNSRRRLEKHDGMPFLIWGYITIIVSILVWYLLKSTGNPQWNFLWFAIPVFGTIFMFFLNKKPDTGVKTFLDTVIQYIWIVFGSGGVIVSVITFFCWTTPVLFIIVLMMGMGASLTGLVIKFNPVVIAGFTGVVLSIFIQILPSAYSFFIFALAFFIMMVIPGHILNYKSKKSHV
ncbi:MAG: hypothetical protein ACK5KP_05995 [Paludibacteraceae bacterium]